MWPYHIELPNFSNTIFVFSIGVVTRRRFKRVLEESDVVMGMTFIFVLLLLSILLISRSEDLWKILMFD